MRTIPRLFCRRKALREERAQNGAWHNSMLYKHQSLLLLGMAWSPGTLGPWAGIPNTCPWCWPDPLIPHLGPQSPPAELRPASCLLLPYLASCQPPPGCLPVHLARLITPYAEAGMRARPPWPDNTLTLQPPCWTLHLSCVPWAAAIPTLAFPMVWSLAKIQFLPPSPPPTPPELPDLPQATAKKTPPWKSCDSCEYRLLPRKQEEGEKDRQKHRQIGIKRQTENPRHSEEKWLYGLASLLSAILDGSRKK